MRRSRPAATPHTARDRQGTARAFNHLKGQLSMHGSHCALVQVHQFLHFHNNWHYADPHISCLSIIPYISIGMAAHIHTLLFLVFEGSIYGNNPLRLVKRGQRWLRYHAERFRRPRKLPCRPARDRLGHLAIVAEVLEVIHRHELAEE